MAKILNANIDPTLGGANASDEVIVSQKAIKTYVDNSIGNGTITFTQGGVTKGSITTNQSSNATIELDAGGGSTITVDDTLSTVSENPVQNKVITAALNNKASVTIVDWRN